MVKLSFIEKVTVGVGFEGSDLVRKMGGKTFQTWIAGTKTEKQKCAWCFRENENSFARAKAP